jgi:hypothetical protein
MEMNYDWSRLTPEGFRHLCSQIDLLEDEKKMLKNQLEHEREKYKEAMKKLKYLVNDLMAEQ